MKEIDKFAELLGRNLAGVKQSQLRFATCKEVDWNEKTMTAVGVSDELEYYDVMLGFGYTDIKPKVGSLCLIGLLEGKETLTFLINAEKVEQVETTIGNIKMTATPDGLLSVENDKYSLRKAFDNLLKAIKAITVPTGTGPSGTPINFAQFDAITTDLNNFLK